MKPGSNHPDPLGRIVSEQRALAILRALDGEFVPMGNREVLSAYLPHIGLGWKPRVRSDYHPPFRNGCDPEDVIPIRGHDFH